MGLFGGGNSSSKNITNNTNDINSGTLAVSGDNSGTLLSGIKNSNITITDGGAVGAALGAMQSTTSEAIEANEAMHKQNTDLITNISSDLTGVISDMASKALGTVERSTDGARDWITTAVKQNSQGTTQEMSKYFAVAVVTMAVASVLIARKGR